MKKKLMIGLAVLALATGIGAAAGIKASVPNNAIEAKATAAGYPSATGIQIIDEINGGYNIISLEYLNFDAGYGHAAFREFLNDFVGYSANPTNAYSTTNIPSSAGWTYMADNETEKYLVCPDAGTMYFPEWVSEISFKIVHFSVSESSWLGVNGNVVWAHKYQKDMNAPWGCGHMIKSYVYNDGGHKLSTVAQDADLTKDWGTTSLTRNYLNASGTEIADSETVPYGKYYFPEYEDLAEGNYVFESWYADNLFSAEKHIVTGASLTIYAKYNLITTDVYMGGSLQGEAFTYNAGTGEFYATVSFAENDSFVLRKTIDGTPADYGYSNLEDGAVSGLGDKISEGASSYITIKTAGAYTLYLKSNGSIWMLSEETVAYEAASYANYFLKNVGCGYPAKPSGWAKIEARYEKVTDDARDYIAGQTAAEYGDEIERMLFTYTMARTNHSDLNDFLVDGNGDAIVSAKLSTPIALGSQNSNTVIALVVIVSIGLLSAGGYFFYRKKHQAE